MVRLCLGQKWYKVKECWDPVRERDRESRSENEEGLWEEKKEGEDERERERTRTLSEEYEVGSLPEAQANFTAVTQTLSFIDPAKWPIEREIERGKETDRQRGREGGKGLR